MEVQFGPNSQDEPSLLYKLQHKLQVFNTTDTLPNRGYNLIACSSKYGIVFVATPDGTLSTYTLKELIHADSEGRHLSIKLQEKPTHIAVSCDQELLAVTNGQLLSVYKVTDFSNPNVAPGMIIRCDVNPSTYVSALQWNPCIPDSIAIAYYDGTLIASQVSTGQIKKIQSKARCICWSPKGKQLVTGNSDGTLTQFKPDLTPAKTVPAPNLYEGAPVEALAIYWISTFQFAVVFRNAADNSRPAVTIVNTPKAGTPSCTNYEDICYSMGTNRPWYYYLSGMPQWNMILCSSSNSMEMATLGSADGANWVQWCQSDEGRPELPLTNRRIENYPVGICIDTSAIHQLPWGENETLPFMPMLLVVSQSGLLTIFNIINLKKEAPQLCSPVQGLAFPESSMISDIPGVAAPVSQPAAPQLQPVQQPTQPPPPYQPQTQPQPQLVQPKPQSQPQTAQPVFTPLQSQAATQFGSLGFGTKPIAQPVPSQAPPSQPQTQAKPIVVPQPQKPQLTSNASPSTQQSKPQSPLTQENAALKEEQEKISKLKANQELKNMLLKEVNEFQMETYKFAVKTREAQIKLQKDITAMSSTFDLHSLDIEELRRSCCLDELRARVVQLKLELVRACAVVAETRTHAQMKDIHEWTHADPLTTKRIASIKKLAYYVQTQLEHAQKALDYKWSDMVQKNPQYNKGRMIRPILDDIYQPLVKQQEILSRQSAVLRTLKNALNECNSLSIVKSTSLLRSTPFKKDPLSKLTKNILNMSIEAKNDTKTESPFTAQKLDALRDMLANNKIVKIKPVNIELSEHMKAIRISYENSMKEKAKSAEKEAKPIQIVETQPAPKVTKQEISKLLPQQPPNLKQNVPGLANVARTLFTDSASEPAAEPSKPISFGAQTEPQKPSFSYGAKFNEPPKLSSGVQASEPERPSISFGTQSEKPPITFTQTDEPRKVTFAFGSQTNESQKPILISESATKDTTKPTFTISPGTMEIAKKTPAYKSSEKPIPEFGQFSFGSQISEQPKPTTSTPTINTQTKSILKDLLKSKSTLNTEAKNDENTLMDQKICSPFSFSAVTTNTSTPLVTAKPIAEISKMFTKLPAPTDTKLSEKAKSDETGEVEASATITIPIKKEDKSKEKPKTPVASTSSIVPDVLKSTQDVKPKPEKSESKENIPEKSKAVLKPSNKENASKEDGNKTAVLTPTAQQTVPSAPVKVEPKAPEKNGGTETASSIFASAASSTPSLFGSASPSSKSIFSNAAPSDTTAKPLFGSSQGSIFGSNSSSSAFTSSIFGAKTTSPDIKPTETKTETSAPSTPETTEVTASDAKSVFGSENVENKPAETKPSSPIVESKPATPVETKPTVFSTPTPASPSSVFGNQSPKPSAAFGSTATSIFASANTQSPVFGSSTTTTTQSVFGSTTTTPSAFATNSKPAFSPSTPVFGATTAQTTFGTATPTTQASIFGSTSTSTSPTPQSVFGAAVTTSTSIFGATTTTTQSLFGGTTTPAQSIFGSAASQSSVFGATTAQSVFGAPTTQSSVFESQPTTQSSLFGATTQASSIFGQAASTPSSIFGSQPTTTVSSGSIFGGENLFAAASISTTSASSPSGGSIFGGGGNTNVFGAKSTFGGSSPSAAAIFGGGASFGQKPAENTNFWGSGNSNTSGGFGSPGFGQTATTQASSIFGGSTGGSFSAPSPGGAFSSPTQQGSVFGTPPQQKAPAFGGSPAFGAKSAFGQPAAFGSPPASGFGSGATFGGFNKSPAGFGAPAAFGAGSATFGGAAFGGSSPGKVFGGTSPAAGFGSTQSNATFENLATQNTMTFGNLAQQSAPAQQPAFNTSPSFTGWRG